MRNADDSKPLDVLPIVEVDCKSDHIGTRWVLSNFRLSDIKPLHHAWIAKTIKTFARTACTSISATSQRPKYLHKLEISTAVYIHAELQRRYSPVLWQQFEAMMITNHQNEFSQLYGWEGSWSCRGAWQGSDKADLVVTAWWVFSIQLPTNRSWLPIHNTVLDETMQDSYYS